VVGAAALLLGGTAWGAAGAELGGGAGGASMIALAVDADGIPRFWAVGMAGFRSGRSRRGVLSWIAVIVGSSRASMMFSGMPSMVRARFGTPTIGRTWMVGEMGEVTESVDPEGMVRIQGGLWKARANRSTPLSVGDRARVVDVDGLLLEVEPEEGGAKDYRELRKNRGGDAAE
jgi:membrane-bound serine protease (ClpP class)